LEEFVGLDLAFGLAMGELLQRCRIPPNPKKSPSSGDLAICAATQREKQQFFLGENQLKGGVL